LLPHSSQKLREVAGASGAMKAETREAGIHPKRHVTSTDEPAVINRAPHTVLSLLRRLGCAIAPMVSFAAWTQ